MFQVKRTFSFSKDPLNQIFRPNLDPNWIHSDANPEIFLKKLNF